VYTSGPGINITGTTISNTGALSVASGSANVTVTQPTTGNYSIAVATPSPAPSYTAGTGISITGNTIANTGVTGVTGTGNIQVSVGPTPTVSITNTPAFSTIGFSTTNSVPQFTWTNAANAGGSQSFAFDSYNGVNVGGILPNAYGIDLYAGPGSNNFIQALDGSGNMAVKGDLYAVGKAASSGKCVQFGSNGLLGAAAAACGAGSVTGLTAGSNIVVGTGATPTVAVTNAPTFTGSVTASSFNIPVGDPIPLLNWANTTTGTFRLGTSSTQASAGVYANAIGVFSQTSGDYLNATDSSGNFGVKNDLNVGHNTSTTAIGLSAPTGAGFEFWNNTANSDGYSLLTTNSGGANGVVGSALTLYSTTGSVHNPGTSLVSVDYNGNMGVAATVSVPNVGVTALSLNRCVHTAGTTYLTSTAADCATKGTLFLPFGFYGGTVNTTIPYPYFQAPGFTAGTITVLRAACATADNGTTVFTFNDVTSSTTIGTISMANAATTATATLGSPFSLTTGHVLNAVVTTAGTATSCGLTAEGTYTLQ
jgi:hypothetical protein